MRKVLGLAATASRCGHCDGVISVGCVSGDFCCEGCQRAWVAARHGARQLPYRWSDVVPPVPRRSDGPPHTHTIGIVGGRSIQALSVQFAASFPNPLADAIRWQARAEQHRVEARALGFTDEEWADQVGRVATYAGQVPWHVDVHSTAHQLLAEFGEVIDPGEAINRRLVAGIERVGAALVSGFRQLGETVSRCAAHLRPLLSEQPPMDPMERALWLRRNRNTGPRQRQRAPRRIDPKTARVCGQARRARRAGQR